jgi:hypothetical protein
MNTETNEVLSHKQASNGLSAIDGIGPKTATALPEIGINSYAELAAYLTKHSATDLSESLAERGVQVAARKIENEDWLGEARKLAGQENTEPANLEHAERAAEEGENTPNRPGSPLDEIPFMVIFRREKDRWKVITYDERYNGPEKEWGIEPSEWAHWILRQMRPHIELDLAPTEAEAGPPPETKIEILAVKPSEAERFKKLAAEVHFELSGSQKDTLAAARTPFWIHVHTVDLVSETESLVASQRRELEPQVFKYKERLEFPIPELGRYELQSLVLLPPPVGRMTLCQGPTFKVVPQKADTSAQNTHA